MNRPFFYYKERINIPPRKAKWLWFQCSVLTWGLAYYWCIQSVLYSLRHPPDYRWIKRCRLLILPILNGDHWTISKPDKNQGTYHVHMNRYKCGITRPGMKKATMMLKSWRSLHLRHIILTAGTKHVFILFCIMIIITWIQWQNYKLTSWGYCRIFYL